MASFLGCYDQKVDIKKRLCIPSELREDLGIRFAMVPSPDGCIYCYPSEIWDLKVAEAVQDGDTPEGRRRQSKLFGLASMATMDKNGRVTLPDKLYSHASLEDSVVIVGAGLRIEIWNPTVYDAFMSVDDELPNINY